MGPGSPEAPGGPCRQQKNGLNLKQKHSYKKREEIPVIIMKKKNLNIPQRIKTSAKHSGASEKKRLLTAFPGSPLSPLGPGPPSTP